VALHTNDAQSGGDEIVDGEDGVGGGGAMLAFRRLQFGGYNSAIVRHLADQLR